MKFKNKLCLLALFSLFLILSVSMVSAEDTDFDCNLTLDDTNENLAVGDSHEKLSGGNIIYISPDGTGSGSSEADPTNWDYALSKANSGDTIQFADGMYYSIKNTVIRDINLKGSGNTIINASNDNGFFATYGNVELNKLSFVDAYTGEKQDSPSGPKTGYNGEGAIVNNGYLTVKDCYFANNQGIGTEGGAIHNKGTCHVYSSEFFKNGGKKGGAIYSDKNSYLYIYDCLIHKCVSKAGSAVHAKEAYVEIHRTSVQNASAKNGLFYIKKSRIYFYDSYFYNCKAVDAAAVINIDKESTVEIDNCIFDKLTAAGSKLWFHQENGTGNGGAIVVEKEGNNVVIKNSNFTNCNAKGEGGAIYIQSNTRVTIDNCTFMSNTAGEGGNHIYTYGSSYSFNIANSKFDVRSSIKTEDIEYGQSENVVIDYDFGTNGVLNPTVYLVLDGVRKIGLNYPGTVNLKDLAIGNHSLTLAASDSYSNEYIFKSSSLFVVGGKDIEAIVSYSIGNDGSVIVKVTDEYGRDIVNKGLNVTLNHETYNLITDSNGKASFKSDVDAGQYEISVVVEGIKVSADSQLKITIPDEETPVSDNVKVFYSYGADGSISVTVVDENGRVINNTNVTLTIDGKTYKATTDSEGVAKIMPENNHAGEYMVDIKVSGRNIVATSSDSIKIMPSSKVSSIIADDMKRAYGSEYDYKFRIFDKNGNPLKNKIITVVLNGNDYDIKTDEDGWTIFKNMLLPGIYEINIQNPSTLEKVTKKITIVNRFSGNVNVKMDYTFSTVYKVRVFNDEGKSVGAGEIVVFKIDGKKVKNVLTDKNGYAILKIKNNNLVPKTHEVSAEYKGMKVSNKLVVKQILKAKNKKFKRYKSKKYSATLKTSNGNPIKGKKIIFKVKGKTYKAKTNKKGVATIKIKGLTKVGKYGVKIIYLKTSIKKSISVKR